MPNPAPIRLKKLGWKQKLKDNLIIYKFIVAGAKSNTVYCLLNGVTISASCGIVIKKSPNNPPHTAPTAIKRNIAK